MSLPGDQDAPFTPQAFPGLSLEFCNILNTPLEDLDPDTLRLLLAAFAQTIVNAMPPEFGMTAGSLFSSLSDRVAALGVAMPDAPPPAALDAAPVAPAHAVPHAPGAPPHPPAAASPAAPPQALPNLPLVSPAPLPEAPAADLPHHAPIAAAAAQITPVTASGRALRGCRPSFLYRTKHAFCRCRLLFCSCGSFFRSVRLQRLPPRHWCYAARASPA